MTRKAPAGRGPDIVHGLRKPSASWRRGPSPRSGTGRERKRHHPDDHVRRLGRLDERDRGGGHEQQLLRRRRGRRQPDQDRGPLQDRPPARPREQVPQPPVRRVEREEERLRRRRRPRREGRGGRRTAGVGRGREPRLPIPAHRDRRGGAGPARLPHDLEGSLPDRGREAAPGAEPAHRGDAEGGRCRGASTRSGVVRVMRIMAPSLGEPGSTREACRRCRSPPRLRCCPARRDGRAGSPTSPPWTRPRRGHGRGRTPR